ncbi:MAG: hypothetical protein JOZ58_27155 [Acetobacteraceae bacterium]|nr:hypothetical protein [Acetobacteraceae bacterium]
MRRLVPALFFGLRIQSSAHGIVTMLALILLSASVSGCGGGRSSAVPELKSSRFESGCNIYQSKGRRTQSACTPGGWDANTPIVGFTQIDPVSALTGDFNSDFDYENFQNIYDSVGMGSDVYDGQGTKAFDPGAYGSQIAMTKQGPPSGNCNGSFKSVGDTAGLANIDGATEQRLVVDINTIYAYGGWKNVGGNKVFLSPTIVGWMYKDNAGAYWFQKDAAISWQFQLGLNINLGKWVQFSTGVSVNGQQGGPVFMGGSLPQEAPHTVDGQCWSGGAKFYTDGIS